MISDLAHQRIHDAVRGLGLPLLTSRISFVVERGIGTAVWIQRDCNEPATIKVDRELALSLEMELLEVLLLHELMHHVGFNHHRIDVQKRNPFLVNLALDILLERTLSANPNHRDSLAALNDKLLDKSTISKKSKLVDAIPFFVHSKMDIEDMPRGFKRRHRQIWRRPTRLNAEDIYQMLVSIPHARNLNNFPESSPYSSRYEARNRMRDNQTEEATGQAGAPHGRPESIRVFLTNLDNKSLERTLDVTLQRRPAPPTESQFRQGRFFREKMWMKHRIRKNIRKVLHYLASSLNENKVVNLALPVCLTPSGISQMLAENPVLYYENYDRRLPKAAAIFIDESQSMSKHYPNVLALIRAIRGLLPSQVFLFDTAVRKTSVSSLLRNRSFSAGGTSYRAVLEHVLATRPSQYFVVSDNGDQSPTDLIREARLRKIRSYGLVFGSVSLAPWDQNFSITE